MRAAASEALAALDGRQVGVAILVEMDLDATVYLSTAGVDLEWDGKAWLGASRVASISEVSDSAGERKSLNFGLSSVTPELLSASLGARIRGKRVRLYEAIVDIDAGLVRDAPLIWTGSLDQMSIEEGAGTGGITVTAEHRGTTFARVKALRYTDGDQQRLHPGDKSLQFVVSQANHQDVWPAAAWFKE